MLLTQRALVLQQTGISLSRGYLAVNQRALVLLGSASHSITVERRKIAWACINPKMKLLAIEDYEKREAKLFGPGFLEKAENPMPKRKGILNKGRSFENDKRDLRSFLSKGTPAQYGGKEEPVPTAIQHQIPIEAEPSECRPNSTDGNTQGNLPIELETRPGKITFIIYTIWTPYLQQAEPNIAIAVICLCFFCTIYGYLLYQRVGRLSM